MIRTGERDQVTGIARPCGKHRETFNWEPDWYDRFAEALYTKEEETNGPIQPRT